MRIAEKEQVVASLGQRLEKSKCLYVADFTGLDVASMTELRRRLAEAEVELVVVKNTLALIAVKDHAGLVRSGESSCILCVSNCTLSGTRLRSAKRSRISAKNRPVDGDAQDRPGSVP